MQNPWWSWHFMKTPQWTFYFDLFFFAQWHLIIINNDHARLLQLVLVINIFFILKLLECNCIQHIRLDVFLVFIRNINDYHVNTVAMCIYLHDVLRWIWCKSLDFIIDRQHGRENVWGHLLYGRIIKQRTSWIIT